MLNIPIAEQGALTRDCRAMGLAHTNLEFEATASHHLKRSAASLQVRLQQAALSRGEAQYRDRQNEIRVATIRITDLQRELNVAAAAASHVGALQEHCHRLSRQLLQVCDR